ncbi:GDP-mannose dehydrogenase [Devosia psychrophila]|uniref:UDP-glucose 6-dehydrogenase n=2 Tax=Devosia psychrophila TaxID=728005 RepID=A0A0F5PZC1_9HYPH|nr:nucleotide sugar dehydrogenase [Devosia psychrophila]KKC33955.1 GDP-mannose dehydrogenase [Devosia psychrophila]SFD18095.1 GDP-mannose 6-dehydrogenase [Devosia psychrophila]
MNDQSAILMSQSTEVTLSRVSVIGAGYVGCVSAACLANDGLRVIAADIDPFKVERINAGLSPMYEPGLDDLTEKGFAAGRLSATTSISEAVANTDISLICVGTPSRDNGSLDTRYVEEAAQQIGASLRHKTGFHVVVMRSTILPGTMENIVLPALENFSGKTAGVDFGLAYYPEFLREGTAIEDYNAPGAIVLGQYADDTRSIEILKSLCAGFSVVPHVIPMRSAEIVKYANNCWHAVKTSFANEMGNLCKAAGIDSHVVLDVVCADTRLNLSRAYMRPGFAYGGSCLPKDLRALSHLGRSVNVPTPMLDATREANDIQLQRAVSLVRKTGNRKVGIIGLTFKANTDDLRESPMLALVENLIGCGYSVTIYDPNVASEENGGRNYLSHIAPLLRESPSDVISSAETLVIGSKYDGLSAAIASATNSLDVIDLVRVGLPPLSDNIRYEGLCW